MKYSHNIENYITIIVYSPELLLYNCKLPKEWNKYSFNKEGEGPGSKWYGM